MPNGFVRTFQRLRRRQKSAPEDHQNRNWFDGVSDEDRAIVERAAPYTMTGPARLLALVDAVRYLESNAVPGAFVECGVWRGGSVLAMIGTLKSLGDPSRDIFLFDTFEGMTTPTEYDVSEYDPPALEVWHEAQRNHAHPWAEQFGPEVFTEASVRETLLASGYPDDRIHCVQGDVLRTIPTSAPEEISLLRLDTDWYESTKHELDHLFPRLAPGGVLIVDDYGHWRGCKQAVDEYFATRDPLLLHRVDYTCRIAVKS